ncbi:MAG: hypothetical protein JOY71_20295 [Acetobacteraceae bacterium]|nr:hypothetical protein [Acetobacteraceae bacterium]
MLRPGDRDDTVVVRTAPPTRRWMLAGLATAAGMGAGVLMWRPWAPRPIPVSIANFAEILADQPHSIHVFRFAANKRVLVLDFASLHEQGRMLNRAAAFLERAGFPHDRVVSEPELEAGIRKSGDEPDTFYYGHDYRAGDLVRFFDAALASRVALTEQERWLGRLVQQEGWTRPAAIGALISIPQLGANSTVDLAARETILRHELSHGEYFTNPRYAAYVRRFWDEVLRPEECDLFRRYLSAQDYDAANEELMMNEMQAYLMFTRDRRFFDPNALGIAPDRLQSLRFQFYDGMPAGWVKDATTNPAGDLL